MTFLCILFTVIALTAVLYAGTVVRRTKSQLSEMLDALSDIKSGNGNRRILAKPHEIAAPIAYEINEIVLSYESRLAALRQTEEAGRRLMTSLSHDVRTPLTTLIGYLDAVGKGIVTGQEREEYLEIARRKSHDLKEYIDVLFDWFRLNSDEFVLRAEEGEMTELTRKVLVDWIPILEEGQIEYEVSIPEQPLRARLDPEGYARILNNLMQNVIAHSRADRLQISLCKCQDGEHGDAIRLELADNGAGMDAGDLEHIFERLYKCDRGRSHKGSGLGLSIVKQLTEKMGGKITVESEPGKGTVFALCFSSEIL